MPSGQRSRLGLHGRCGGELRSDCFFSDVVAGIQHELHIHRPLPKLGGDAGDAVGKLGFHPIELETVRRGYPQATLFEIKGRERFYPGAVLLRRKFLLQLRSTGLPKFFHAIGLV